MRSTSMRAHPWKFNDFFFVFRLLWCAISIGNWIFLLWYAHSKVRSQIGIEKRAIISFFNRKIACESEVGCCIIIARCATSDAGVARLSRRKKKWLIERQIHRDYADALLFLYAVSPARDLSPRELASTVNNWCIIMIFLPIISL